MEKIICTLINHTSQEYIHEILALDRRREAIQWIRGRVEFVDFEKSHPRRRFFWALYTALQRIQPDLLMTYSWGATDAIWLGRIAGIRRIIHNEHGFNVDEGKTTHWKRDLIRFLVYRFASRLIVVSRELEGLLRRRYLLRAGRVRRIPNGIDTSYYSPDSTVRQRMRKELGFDDTHIVIGFSGRLDPVKNLSLLINIFAGCLQRRTDLRLLVVGDGPERKHLETLCQEKNLQSHILFAGQQEDVLSYLRAMDLLLLTSFREQMSLTVLEAMGVGIPVIAAKVGEIPYIVDHGTTGFVLDRDAPVEAYIEHIFALLPESRRVAMGSAARQKIADCFQEKAMVEEYKRVIDRDGGTGPYEPIQL